MDPPESPAFDPTIASFYAHWAEETRHLHGVFQLEASRTRELVARFAPPPPAIILDVGGAAGVYALWLASEGYEVHLLDAVPRLVREARRQAKTSNVRLASAGVGDARTLPYEDASADCVLLLGPMYHLVETTDRTRAVSEAARVLKPSGVLLAACITRWASLLDGLAHDYLGDPQFAALVTEDLKTGQHRNPTGQIEYFTTAYFHKPAEFALELRGSGLHLEGLFGVEGPAGLVSDFDDRWSDPRRRADLLRAAREVESEPSLLGLSAHLVGVARKGGS